MQVDKSIELVTKIQDELGIDFGWRLYSDGLVLPVESLQAILTQLQNNTYAEYGECEGCETLKCVNKNNECINCANSQEQK
jgi:hypothetical protein